ncbi:VirB4 family type IV secretion/conjugal transfer ATPase [Sphingomonas carotinifaciens]|uniref:Type IV secretion system protein virB4 n=1 Tax=Sphingomonas carotinifaciens TaxID=1166323 RepID=A0A1G7M356_9SPHN|nr:VirB4 family type IV secretion/conjugal transfer ATPase [Sphingomonas carotinifaciens]MBB4086954.1 type IV secretion system protein VirB4 [Sphingomonas carotinifaciens]MWC42148.1 VirB4 family type IV secretion/conjugal transfer ATPase [Sphingomonas carotinifaciens]SDF55609.1 type IV secretion system protein VirB4 [Sphingomonas carotinifaciens]
MRKWIGPAAWGPREAKAGDRLPYARLLDEETLTLRDGGVMQVIAVPGIAFETEESEQLDHMLAVRETMLRSALDARFVIYHHVVRRQVEATLADAGEDPFSRELGRRWDAARAARRLYVNDQYLTVLRRPARGKTGWAEKLSRRLNGRGEIDPATVRELDAAVTALVAGLSAYSARVLGGYDGAVGRCSEPLELLSALYNGETRPVLTPPDATDCGHHIPYARISFGVDAIETRLSGGRRFAGMLSVKEYPDATRAGLIDNLLRLPHELILTESFAPADRQVARERIDLAIRRLKSADAEAAAERSEMMAARDGLGAGQVGFGDHHLSVLVRAETLGELERAAAQAGAALADMGAVAVREDTGMEPAFWGQFPGNEAYVVRRSLISTANAAGFLSLHGFPGGRASGNHWGDAVSVLETTSATPYFFNFHAKESGGDLGNFTVIGPSGSGKTVALNFLAAQAQRFGPRLVFFDKDRGAEIFLRAIGGHYSRLTPGEPTGMNPLALPDTPANQAFLREWLAVLLQADGAEELAMIASAVAAAYDHDPAFRRLRHLGELLGGTRRPEAGDLVHRLQPWIGSGENAWLFDNAVDRLHLDARTLGFDMTQLLDSPRLRTPAMMYLFHRIDERLDGEPTMILIDEGWKALDDPVFAGRIRDWLKTLRKRNALVGFATQSAGDALGSSIASAIVEQTATMIFMPNAKAKAEDYCTGFGLTEHELALIRALPAESRCFLVRHANHSVVVRLDLSGTGEMLAVLSGREASVRRLDSIRAHVGDDPAHWYPLLTGAAWPGGPATSDDSPWYMEAAE